MDWTTEELGFDSRKGQDIFLFSTVVQTGSWAHPASYPMGTGGSSPRWSGQDVKLTIYLHAKAKNAWSHISAPTHKSSCRGV
jgi:hypothetical protein